MAAVFGICRAAADARMTVSDIYYDETRGSWGIEIGIENAGRPVNAFQCDIAIPATFAFATNSAGTYKYVFTQRAMTTDLGQTSATHSCAPALRSNGTLRLVVYSAANTPFGGTSGAVMFVALTPLDETTPTDNTFQCNLTNQVLTWLEGGMVRSVYPDGIINDEELLCYDSMGNHVAMYAINGYSTEEALYDDLSSVVNDLATNDRVVTVDLTNYYYLWDGSFVPKNPNALFFCLAEDQILNTENVFFPDGSGLRCTNLVLYDEGLSFEFPYDTPAVADRFTFDRTFPAGQWNTVMLPVSLSDEQFAALRASGVEIARLDKFDADNATLSYAMSERFEANTPYLVRHNSTAQVFADLGSVPVSLSTCDTVITAGELSMHGNYDYRLISSTADIFRYGYNLDTGEFIKIGNDCRLYPFRCYLELAGVSSAKAARSIAIKGGNDKEQDATGINGIAAGADGRHTIYTIDGRRMNVTDCKTLRPGVYIVDGRKVTVK